MNLSRAGRQKLPAIIILISLCWVTLMLITGSSLFSNNHAWAGPAANLFVHWKLSPQTAVIKPQPIPGKDTVTFGPPYPQLSQEEVNISRIPLSPWDTGSFRVGSVVRDPKTGVYRMYYESSTVYTTADGNNISSQTAIGVAVSDDGIKWDKVLGGAPIFGPTQIQQYQVTVYITAGLYATYTFPTMNGPSSGCPAGTPVSAWDAGFVGMPRVVWDGTRYRMFYIGGPSGKAFDPNAPAYIGEAESSDGINFCRVSANPVLVPTPGAWDALWVAPASAAIENSVLKLYYTGTADNIIASSGIARSPSGFSNSGGIALTKDSANPIKVNGSTNQVKYPFVLNVEGTKVMWLVSNRTGTDLIYQAYSNGGSDYDFTLDPSNNIIQPGINSPNDLVGQVDLATVFDMGFLGRDPYRDAVLYFTGFSSNSSTLFGFRAIAPDPTKVIPIGSPSPGEATVVPIPTAAGPKPTPTKPLPAFPPVVPGSGPGSFFTPTPGDGNYPPFYNVWLRVDDPVKAGFVSRSWIYSNVPFGFRFLRERYEETSRLVLYHDKARMEAVGDGGVTNGLLAKELVTGLMQVGDNKFEQRLPANETVAGDPIELNPIAPAYYSFANVATINRDRRAANKTGQSVQEIINRLGEVGVDFAKGGSGVTYAYYESQLGHNIPNVFWDFMQQSGIVRNSAGSYSNEQVINWVSVMGLPITEPYWSRAIVAGREVDVLIQVYERRILTYTPSNPDGFKVEMGNVGRHYFRWRYGMIG